MIKEIKEPVENCRPRKTVERKIESSKGPWLDEEHELFMSAINKYGNSWVDVSKHVKTRSPNQCCSHSQKYFRRVARLEAKRQRENPATKNYVFVVTKCFYNTTLVPNRQILSYRHNKRAKANNDIEDSKLQSNLKEAIESEEGEMDLLHEENYTKENKIETEDDVQIIYNPVSYYPLDSLQSPLIYPPNCNPIREKV